MSTGHAPKIQFSTMVHDFGRASAGQVVRVSFTFTNTGDAPLRIDEVRPSCGCTAAGRWERLVEPGRTGTIPLQLATISLNGPVTKTITVTCNDPVQPRVMLQIKGQVWKPIEVTPTFVYFNLTSAVQTVEPRTVKIINRSQESLTLSEPQSSSPVFRAVLTTNTAGKEFELAITAVPPFGFRTIQGAITLKTSSTNLPVVSVSALAQRQPPLVFTGQLFVPPGPLVTATSLSVIVRNTTGTPLKLSSPSVSAPGVESRIVENEPGRSFDVMVTLPAGFHLEPGHPVQLTVKTSSTEIPLITVPILQMSQPRGAGTLAPPRLAPPPAAPAPVRAGVEGGTPRGNER
ncbi:MAG: DUF1573 domain-containing protein [Limisphaerales bacterium]